jgi:hypothetical protein
MAHHASMSDEQRRALERSLKNGDLPALVDTSSLELGIDIGSIELAGFLVNATDISYVLDEPEGPLARLYRLKSNTLGMLGEEPILALEENGQRVLVSEEAPRDAVTALIQALLCSPQGSGRLEVRSWNGEPVMETDGEEVLHTMGFRRDYPAMVFDVVQARAASRGRKSP